MQNCQTLHQVYVGTFPPKINWEGSQINSRYITEHNTQHQLAEMIPDEGISFLARLLASHLPAPTLLRGSPWGLQLSSPIFKYSLWVNQIKLNTTSFPEMKRPKWWCQEFQDVMFTALQPYPLNRHRQLQLTTERALQGTAVTHHCPERKQKPTCQQGKEETYCSQHNPNSGHVIWHMSNSDI